MLVFRISISSWLPVFLCRSARSCTYSLCEFDFEFAFVSVRALHRSLSCQLLAGGSILKYCSPSVGLECKRARQGICLCVCVSLNGLTLHFITRTFHPCSPAKFRALICAAVASKWSLALSPLEKFERLSFGIWFSNASIKVECASSALTTSLDYSDSNLRAEALSCNSE